MPQSAISPWARLAQLAFATLTAAGLLSAAAALEASAVRCAYAAAFAGVLALHLPAVAAGGPDHEHRRGPTVGAAEERNASVLALASFGGSMATLLVAALDRRHGWSPDTCLALRVLALLVMAIGYMLFAHAMATNKAYVAGQHAHRVRRLAISKGGFYRVVRHPAYLGMILCSLATPSLLGSKWALIPAILTVGCFIALTALEDRDLQTELAGYQEYARQVQFRLLPGLW